ncbi:MAG: hypothetical protein ACHQIL_02575 [Steroidobacterales bacterium]
MATSADKRITELLDRWLTSLELHLKYTSLDDDTYWKVQPWVEHQRPTRWIVDLARQKTAALKQQVEERIRAGDAKFSDALEQMMFLANLVGLQHIERFIPVAEPGQERGEPLPSSPATTGTREMPQLSTATTATREMLKPPAPTPRPPPPSALVARVERKTPAPAKAAPKSPPKGAARSRREQPAAAGAAAPSGAADAPRKQVMADAARLLQWGRKWYELADLIARMADRPSVHVVRRLLDENRAQIEKSVLEKKP